MIGQLADGNRLVDMSKTLAAGGHLMSVCTGTWRTRRSLVEKSTGNQRWTRNNNVSKWTYMFSDCEKTVFVYVDGHVQQAPKRCRNIYIYISRMVVSSMMCSPSLQVSNLSTLRVIARLRMCDARCQRGTARFSL